jgi:mannose-1-phosphate guanylyltransferase
MPAMTGTAWGLVLAGGDGTRLRALTELISGSPIPKQYCRILGDRSLLESTLGRIAPLVPPERTLVIVNHDHLTVAGEQLRPVPDANVLVQPRNRETGPGLVLSLLALARRAPHALVAVFPSDHYVEDDGAFRLHVARAYALVTRLPEKVVLLGMRPRGAEPGLGYIEPAGAVAPDAFDVAAFHACGTRS